MQLKIQLKRLSQKTALQHHGCAWALQSILPNNRSLRLGENTYDLPRSTQGGWVWLFLGKKNMYIYIYICIYVCMYVCVYVCMYVCIYIYISLARGPKPALMTISAYLKHISILRNIGVSQTWNLLRKTIFQRFWAPYKSQLWDTPI